MWLFIGYNTKMHQPSCGVLQRGLTAVEVVIVVILLGVIAAIVLPKLLSEPEGARTIKVKQDLIAIDSALQLYHLHNGFYPSTTQHLQALVTKPTTTPRPTQWKPGGYLKFVPMDPWNRPYHYQEPGDHNPDSFDLFTYGADNKPKGDGEDADVGNWDSEGR